MTNGGGLAAYLILLVIAHAEAVNRNERRVRTSEVLRPREVGTMTNWKGLKACEFNWCPPFQVCHKAYAPYASGEDLWDFGTPTGRVICI